jgi:hypothetical protein
MEKNKEPRTNHEPPSSHKKDSLIEALHPLRNDFTWMSDLITIIKVAPLIESDFEISGLARKIVYELILENPALFAEDNEKTHPLKNLMIQLLSNVKVLKNRKETIAKAIEEAYNSEIREKAATKKQSKG